MGACTITPDTGMVMVQYFLLTSLWACPVYLMLVWLSVVPELSIMSKCTCLLPRDLICCTHHSPRNTLGPGTPGLSGSLWAM